MNNYSYIHVENCIWGDQMEHKDIYNDFFSVERKEIKSGSMRLHLNDNDEEKEK